MSRPIRITLVVVLALSATLLAFRGPAEKYFEIAKSLDIFATLFKEVNSYYVDDVEPEKLVRKGIEGMLESLDPYTMYIPEEELENFRIQTTGQYGGIGALIGIVNKRTVITHPYRDFPAYKAGLMVGDEIIAVDGKSVEGKPTSETSALMKGAARTDVELTIRRYGVKDDIKFKIRRDRISVSNLTYAGMISATTGYLLLEDFTPGAGREVEEAVKKLKQEGAKSIILDLRDNPGGLLQEAVNIVSVFVPRGKEVVSTKGRVEEWNKSYSTLNSPVDLEIPLVVLVNGGSASASEILSGSLQDYDRAVLIGSKTFGKGLVQTTRPLSYNAQLKLTTAKYYIPSGRCIQALDYSHRNADGSVDRHIDSLRTAFKTAGGRTVFDGNGIDPDIKVDDGYVGDITEALINSGLTFEYATRYFHEHRDQKIGRGWKLSDAEYNAFVTWVKAQKFTYSTEVEARLQRVREAAEAESRGKEIQTNLDQLAKVIAAGKEEDLVRYRDEIAGILESEIAFRYDLTRAEVDVRLDHDPAVLRALSLLADPGAYRSILTAR
jgi:carboxyl-terminal processing protease